MTPRHRIADLALSLVLLAYPRAFRRRFGAEMRADFQRTLGAPGTRSLQQLGTFAANGVAERATSIKKRFAAPAHQPHLYYPQGRHAMFWDSVQSDLRHAVRIAIKSPVFTGLTVLALALGIGANSAIFAVVDGILLKPLPYADTGRLVVVWSDATKDNRPRNTLSPANFRDFATMNSTLTGLEGYFSFITNFEILADGPSEVVNGMMVTPGLFDLLGRQPMLGRGFGAQAAGAALEVVISHGYWQRRFGADPAVVGRKLELSSFPATVVGVMPEDFTFPYGAMLGPSGFTRATTVDAWAPIAFQGPLAQVNRLLDEQGQLVRGVHWFGAIGRMKPGVTVASVQADLSTVADQLAQQYPETNAGWGATVVPAHEQTVGAVRAPLLVLLAGVGFVLLMASVNVANLVLARSVARQKEMAMRAALGAGRARLAQQAVTESLLFAAAGGLFGLLFTRWGVDVLVALAPPDLPRIGEVSADVRVLAVTAGVSILTGVLVGLLPALSAAGTSPQAALQEHSRGSTGAARRGTRAALVVAEVALAVTLTIGAGLLLRSFVSLTSVDAGFESDRLLTMKMNLPDRLSTPAERLVFYDELFERLSAVPGVVSAGGTTRLPLGSTSVSTRVDVEGRPKPRAEWPEVQFRRALHDFFHTMGTPIVRGRDFARSDGPDSEPVCLINQALADLVFPGEDPIGRRMRTGPNDRWSTVIGIVGNLKHGSLDEVPAPEFYISHRQGPPVTPFLVVRTAGEPADMVETIRAVARSLDEDLPLYDVQTMETVRGESLAQRRFILMLVAAFGVLALVMAAVGVYGVMTLVVSERTAEMGVRLALGAQPGQLLGMVVRQAATLGAIGCAIGVLLAIPMTPLMANQLYGIEPTDPLTLTAVPLLLMLVATLAAVVSARRAMRVNPNDALRT